MPPWLISIGKWLGLQLLEKVFVALKQLIKEQYEDHKTRKEIKAKVKQLKESKTPEEIRAAIRNLNI